MQIPFVDSLIAGHVMEFIRAYNFQRSYGNNKIIF